MSSDSFLFSMLWSRLEVCVCFQLFIIISLPQNWAPLVDQMVKNLPAMWETGVQPLGWEYPLEKSRATYSSSLARRIQWTEEPGRLQFMRLQRVRHD